MGGVKLKKNKSKKLVFLSMWVTLSRETPQELKQSNALGQRNTDTFVPLLRPTAICSSLIPSKTLQEERPGPSERDRPRSPGASFDRLSPHK